MNTTPHPYIEVRRSAVHNSGVFARISIPKGTRIIEYLGDKITKEESARRAVIQLDTHKEDSTHGAVYIFELDEQFDIDGKPDCNTAKYINHSCDPNCEVDIIDGRIWILALRDIKEGEELSYNYKYDYDSYSDHPCRCESSRCVGFILDEKYWPQLNEELEKKDLFLGLMGPDRG